MVKDKEYIYRSCIRKIRNVDEGKVAGPGLGTVGDIARHATDLHLIINKYVIRGGHRQIIQLDGKREGADASSVKLNLTFHCCTVPWLRDARPAGWIKCCSICASTLPKS